jgi:hypothetical protein
MRRPSPRAWSAVALAAALCSLRAAPARADDSDAGTVARLFSLPDDERAALVKSTSREELAAFFKATAVEDLLALGRRALPGLGVYGARLTKQERVRGELLEAQSIQLVARDTPLAARLTYVEGPAKGRRLVYNAELRKDEMRVREGGLFGFIALWINLDSSLARKDTNHRVSDLGFRALIDLIARDLETVRPQGGFTRLDEGFDERGLYCMHFVAPKGAKGLTGDESRICVDAALGLPLRTEVYAGGQLQERYLFERVTPRLTVPPNYFTPEAAGL